jgi:hypothetical protein
MTDVPPPEKPRRSDVDVLRRGLTTMSLRDTHRALHGFGVARAVLAEIRQCCARALAEDVAINPVGLMAFIDDNMDQLNVDTAVAVDTEATV